MTIKTYPLDLLAGFPGTTTRFELTYVQEVNPTRGGSQGSVDLGPALWEMDVQSKPLRPLDLRRWKARIAALEGAQQTFNGYDLTACYPMAYPNGSWPTGLSFNGIGSLNAVDTDTNKQIKVAGLPEGYVISEGDYVSFADTAGARCLHQSLEQVTVPSGGVSPYFEVRPYVRPGYTLTNPVALTRPHAVMVIVPGSVSQSSGLDGVGAIQFKAQQTL